MKTSSIVASTAAASLLAAATIAGVMYVKEQTKPINRAKRAVNDAVEDVMESVKENYFK